jgi:hypothetical protein
MKRVLWVWAVSLVLTSALWKPYRTKYRLHPKTDVPFTSMAGVKGAADACSNTPGCRAYNSNGVLKRCTDCGEGEECCAFPQGQPYPPADNVDLFIANPVDPPPLEWQDDVDAGTILYSQPEPTICYMPEIGNGYVASIVSFASMHVAGLYDGACGSTHKAKLPSPTASITVVNAVANRTQSALDTKRGMYLRRYTIGSSVVEQRLYAHRVRKHILVCELELLSGDSVDVELKSLFDPICEAGGGSSTCSPPAPGCKCPVPHPTCKNTDGRCVVRSDGSHYPYVGMPCTKDTDCGICDLAGDCKCDSNCCVSNRPSVPTPAPEPMPTCHTDGNGCAGTWKAADLSWVLQPQQLDAVTLHVGTTSHADDEGHKQTAAIQTHVIPSSVTLHKGSVKSFISAVVSSVGQPNGFNISAAASEEHAAAVADESKLLDEHSEAWAGDLSLCNAPILAMPHPCNNLFARIMAVSD